MNMQVVLLKEHSLIRVHMLYQADRDPRGFLHHISELSGHDDIALPLHQHGFYKQDVAARLRPRKPGHNARLALLQHAVMADRFSVKQLL